MFVSSKKNYQQVLFSWGLNKGSVEKGVNDGQRWLEKDSDGKQRYVNTMVVHADNSVQIREQLIH